MKKDDIFTHLSSEERNKRNKHILIVEDNTINQRILEMEGYTRTTEKKRSKR